MRSSPLIPSAGTAMLAATLLQPALANAATTPSDIAMPTDTDKVTALLDSLNTGDPTPIAYIDPEHYTQHNLTVADGVTGFVDLIKAAPSEGFKATVHRAFSDGDHVVTHTEYDIFGPKAGFDIFRFEHGRIVEHWDNLAAIAPPNPSGRTQFDGATDITDQDMTDANKTLVGNFVNAVLVEGRFDTLPQYIDKDEYLQHNADMSDGLDGLAAAIEFLTANDIVLQYSRVHKVLGEGNFVLTVSEGLYGPAPGVAASYYDLFRVANGKIVEHWDVIEAIAPNDQWKNDNGKF